jgi:hypothetical protein
MPERGEEARILEGAPTESDGVDSRSFGGPADPVSRHPGDAGMEIGRQVGCILTAQLAQSETHEEWDRVEDE